MTSEYSGARTNPIFSSHTDDWPPPPTESEDVRATKKVKHRDNATTPTDYRERLLAGSEMEATMETVGHDKGLQLEAGDVVIDKSGLIPAISLSPKLKEKLTYNMRFSVIVNLLDAWEANRI